MAIWTLAAVVCVIFMTLYGTQDFAERMNFKIAPSFDFQLVIVGIMVFNCIFCYLWEVRMRAISLMYSLNLNAFLRGESNLQPIPSDELA